MKKNKTLKYNRGEMAFGLEVLLFVVAIFIIWVLFGGGKKPVEDKPFITPFTDPVNPGTTYGSNEKPYNQNTNN
jgi:hypothetical protein